MQPSSLGAEASGSSPEKSRNLTYDVAPPHALPQTPFYSIEYPGFVGQSETSINTAIKTLGGQTSLDHIFRQPKARILELRLRPDDVYAHPIPGELVPPGVGGVKLLLKVTKRRRRKKLAGGVAAQEGGNGASPGGTGAAGEVVDSGSEPVARSGLPEDESDRMDIDPSLLANPANPLPWEDGGEFTAEVVGTIPKTVRFRAIADYQYSPDPIDPMIQLRNSMENLDDETLKRIQGFKFAPEMEEYTLPLPPEEAARAQLDPSLPQNKSNLQLPPPPIFMRASLPSLYNYKPNPFSVVQTVTNEETGEEKQRLINKTRFKGFGALSVDFADPGPVPSKAADYMEQHRSSVNTKLLDRVIQLLNERPVWSRVALLNQFSPGERREIFNSKAILPLAAYCFSDGPFRDAYVRFGYDPRKDIEARFYQRVTFRNAGHHFRRRPLLVPGEKSDSSQSNLFAASHVFDGKSAPYELSPGFQLCDIHDPMLKRMIQHASGLRENGECHERDGFYTAAALDRIKAVLKRKLTALIEEGREISDSECADIMAREPTLTRFGAVKEFRIVPPHDGRKDKRNRAKHVISPEEAVAARLRAAVKKRGVADGSEEDED